MIRLIAAVAALALVQSCTFVVPPSCPDHSTCSVRITSMTAIMATVPVSALGIP